MPFWTLENPEKRPLTYFTLKLGSLIFVLEKWIFPGIFHHGKIPKKGDKQGCLWNFMNHHRLTFTKGVLHDRYFQWWFGLLFIQKVAWKKMFTLLPGEKCVQLEGNGIKLPACGNDSPVATTSEAWVCIKGGKGGIASTWDEVPLTIVIVLKGTDLMS